MCIGGSDRPLQPPPPPKPPPPPAETAVFAKQAKQKRGTKKHTRRGTKQLTVQRPTMGGSYGGSGVNLPT